jgi:hypothetical protein
VFCFARESGFLKICNRATVEVPRCYAQGRWGLKKNPFHLCGGTAMRSRPSPATNEGVPGYALDRTVDAICELKWSRLTRDELTDVAWVYYHFSVQFRENLEIARSLFPDDAQLIELDHGERDTDNLSPWPGVAAAGEKMNHDEFMRRTLALAPIAPGRRSRLEGLGQSYLASIRAMNRTSRAMSIASYEDGGLEKVFRAFLTAPQWDTALLQAFRHFLTEHIRFDSDPEHGHGALARHLAPNGSVVPLWTAFRQMLVAAVPALS